MCNLYSITRSQGAIRRLFAVSRDLTGNLPPLPDVFPDQMGPVVRVADGERQFEMIRWGMPGAPRYGGVKRHAANKAARPIVERRNRGLRLRLVDENAEAPMAITKISSKGADRCARSEVSLATGATMAMRMWQDEEPQEKEPRRSPYETLGYVISGRAELTIEGETVELEPGDSWLVPANTEHTYRIIETFTSVECTSPPAIVVAC